MLHISFRLGAAQSKSVEFSAVSCFQRGFAVGATISLVVGNLSTQKETFLGLKEYFEQTLDLGERCLKYLGEIINGPYSVTYQELVWLSMGSSFLRYCLRRKQKRVEVTFSEEKQKEKWMCGGNSVRLPVCIV